MGFIPAFSEYNYSYNQLNSELGANGLLGQNAIVTGANSGIGYWAALHLARLGANVVLACRNENKCDAASRAMEEHIRQNSTKYGSIECMSLDTSSLGSVRKFASNIRERGHAVHILLLNAGIAGDPSDPNATTVDGLPLTLGTNHIGHQLLYELLLPQILDGASNGGQARVVFTSSAAHYQADAVPLSKEELFTGGQYRQYGRSKLANILCANEAARQLKEMETKDERAKRVYVNSMHPGLVDTNIFEPVKKNLMAEDSSWSKKFAGRLFSWLQNNHIFWTSEEGALTLLYLAASPDVPKFGIRGKYYHPQGIEATPNVQMVGKEPTQLEIQRDFWRFTQTLYEPFSKLLDLSKQIEM